MGILYALVAALMLSFSTVVNADCTNAQALNEKITEAEVGGSPTKIIVNVPSALSSAFDISISPGVAAEYTIGGSATIDPEEFFENLGAVYSYDADTTTLTINIGDASTLSNGGAKATSPVVATLGATVGALAVTNTINTRQAGALLFASVVGVHLNGAYAQCEASIAITISIPPSKVANGPTSESDISNGIRVYTLASSSSPTMAPTTPTNAPTNAPTSSPVTTAPSTSPTTSPSASPTVSPTASPSTSPTTSPTMAPTDSPTTSPTANPTASPTPPTAIPTSAPTQSPTVSFYAGLNEFAAVYSNGFGEEGTLVEVMINTNLDRSRFTIGFGRRLPLGNKPNADNALFNTLGTSLTTFSNGTTYCGGIVQLIYAERDPDLNLGSAIESNANLNIWLAYDGVLIDHMGMGGAAMNNFTVAGTPAYNTIPRAITGNAVHQSGDRNTAGLTGSTDPTQLNTLTDFSTTSVDSPDRKSVV